VVLAGLRVLQILLRVHLQSRKIEQLAERQFLFNTYWTVTLQELIGVAMAVYNFMLSDSLKTVATSSQQTISIPRISEFNVNAKLP
jgi:hypothetical protein